MNFSPFSVCAVAAALFAVSPAEAQTGAVQSGAPSTGRASSAALTREVLLLSTADGVQLSALLTSPASGFNAAAPAIIHIGDGPGVPLTAPTGAARGLAEGLAQRGYGNLSLETRMTERYAFSRFDESIADVKAAIDALVARGVSRIVLSGQGLGAAIVARYTAETGDARVRALILESPGGDPAAVLAARVGAQRFAELIESARRSIETGQRTFIDAGGGIIFTAATFLDWFGPETVIPIAKNVAAVEAPLLIVGTPAQSEALKSAATASNSVTTLGAIESGAVSAWLGARGLAAPAPVTTQLLDVKAADGTELSGLLYAPMTPASPQAPAFIIVHGWASDVMRSTAHWLGLRLAQRGYPALAIRHRASGFRGTVRGTLEDTPPDIAAWVDLIAARGHRTLIGVGHSAGSLWLSYYLATTKDARIKALVYLAPQRDLPRHARTAMGEDLYARAVLEAEEAIRDGKGATHLIQAPFPRAVYDEDERQPMYIPPPNSGFTYYYADAFLSYWGPRSKAVHTELIKPVDRPLLALGGSRDAFMQGGWLISFTEAAGAKASYKFYGGPTGAPHSFEGYQALVTDDILAWIAKLPG